MEALRRLTSVDIGKSETLRKSQGLEGNNNVIDILLTATKCMRGRDKSVTDAASAVGEDSNDWRPNCGQWSVVSGQWSVV